MDRMIGHTLGSYRILERIGVGGMATVYKAYQPALDRDVAIKILPVHLSGDPGFSRRFKREAHAVAKLEHAHILPIYDYGQEHGLSYIVMRYVEGGTLKERMGEPMKLRQVADVIDQIAEALDYAHDEGIVHRDVKPSNVLLDRGDRVLLTDFGVARIVEAAGKLTASGVGVGTPAYMSPEQGRGERVDRRSDVYSLGVMLYEMLTGRVPYEAETPVAVVWKHVHDPLPLPRSINPTIPEGVERVALKALAKASEDRYRTAGEMARVLRGAVQEAEVKEVRPPLDEEALTRDEIIMEPGLESKPKRLRRLWWLVPLVLLVATAGLVVARPRWLLDFVCDRLGYCAQATTQPSEAGLVGEAESEPRVAFVSDRDGNLEIYRMDVDGSNQVNLTNHPAADTEPAWSPDGNQIAFVSERDGDKEIYITDRDGTNPVRLTNDPSSDESPAWGSDGTQIAFTSDRSGRYEIYVMDTDGLNVRQITNNGAHMFAWSPNGERIAYIGDFVGGLYSVSLDGSGLVQLMHNAKVHRPPVWSINGDRIAVVSYHKYFTGRIYYVNHDGSEMCVLGLQKSGESFDWSPDGTKMIVNGHLGSPLYLFDLNSGFMRIIYQGITDGLDWLANGATISFLAGGDIYTIDADGRASPVNLTNSPGYDGDPDWWWPESMLLSLEKYAPTQTTTLSPQFTQTEGTGPDIEEVSPTFEACLVMDVGGIDDGSFNATTWEGVEKAIFQLGVEGKYHESRLESDYTTNINAFITESCDLIISVGFHTGDAIAEAAERNPDQMFTIVDFAYDPSYDNVLGQVYATDQAAFLAGYVAAAVTKTGKVGTFGGMRIPPVTNFMDGFYLGVQYYNQQHGTSVVVLGWNPTAQTGFFTGNFDSFNDGRDMGRRLMDDGADILFPVAGVVGLGTATVALESGNTFIIGVDSDWVLSAPAYADITLTSVMKNMDETVFDVIQNTVEGNFVGGVYVGTLENGGVGIAHFHKLDKFISDELKAELEEIQEAIIRGEIRTSYQ